MTKTLSEQLCEIVGFGKHKIEDKSFCWCDKCKYKVGLDGCQRTIGEPCPPHYKFVYPDFEQPENFVKLLEIVSRKAGVSFCHNGAYFGCSIHYFFKDIFEADEGTIQHNFLNTLLKQDLRNPCKPKLLDQIKQSICDYDGWVWG